MRALQGAFGKQDAVVGDDADRIAVNMREAANQGRAIQLLELFEDAAVDDPRDEFAAVVWRADILGHHAVDFLRRI